MVALLEVLVLLVVLVVLEVLALLRLLPVKLEHGIELIGEVGEHGPDVVENVASVPSRCRQRSVRLKGSIRKSDAGVGTHPDRASLLVCKRNPRLTVKAGVSLQLKGFLLSRPSQAVVRRVALAPMAGLPLLDGGDLLLLQTFLALSAARDDLRHRTRTLRGLQARQGLAS